MEKKGLKELSERLQADLMACATDPHGPHVPQWERRVFSSYDRTEEWKPGKGVVITVEYSRDPSRSHDGGEYYHYARYLFCDGGVSREGTSSCEIDDREPESEIFAVALSQEGLERLADLVAKRVTAELVPEPIDLTKVRRRVEDALRKTATGEDLVAIAGLLGVKTA